MKTIPTAQPNPSVFLVNVFPLHTSARRIKLKIPTIQTIIVLPWQRPFIKRRGEVRDNAARGRCTTQPWSNAPSHYQRYTWRIVDLNLDPVLRNFVLLSAHGCCVWSEHLTAPSTRKIPSAGALPAVAFLSARPTVVQQSSWQRCLAVQIAFCDTSRNAVSEC